MAERKVKITYESGGVTEFHSNAAAELIKKSFETNTLSGTSLISLPYYDRNLILNMRNVRSIEL